MEYRGLVLLSISVCFHMGLTLRCACRENSNYCTSFRHMSVDFKTAEENCTAMGGKLPMRWNDTVLLNEKGHFWIGAKHECSKTDVRGDTPRSVNQARKDTTCSLQCMSVSSNRTQTERPCTELLNGFLCEGVPWESCWMENPREVIILSEKNCLLAPCEHRCDVAPDGVGYVCSCYSEYRLSSRGPRYCSYECSSSPCEAKCQKCTGTGQCSPSCYCPDGFVRDEKHCADIDECASNHICTQKCENTLGSYACSCSQDYMLVNRSECVPRFRSEGDPSISDVLRPSMNYTTSHAGFSTPGEYIGLTVFIVLAVAALIVLLYYLRKRKSNVDLNTYDDLNDARSQERL